MLDQARLYNCVAGVSDKGRYPKYRQTEITEIAVLENRLQRTTAAVLCIPIQHFFAPRMPQFLHGPQCSPPIGSPPHPAGTPHYQKPHPKKTHLEFHRGATDIATHPQPLPGP